MNDIILVAKNGSNVTLKLNNDKKPYTVEEILDIHAKVYSDTIYTIDISCENISEIIVYINGESVVSDYRDGMIYFGRENERVFAGIIGLAQISLFIIYQNGETEWAYSEYASVLIKASETNKALDLMLKYVYKNQEDILHRDSKVTEIGKQYNEKYEDFWSQIVLLEEIANVYENNYGYFKANFRYKLEKVDVMARKKRAVPGINSSSTADIAFMLLIFFLITTSMDTDRGLARRLPPPPENKDQKQDDIIVKERNVLQVRLNKDDQLMCGQDYIDIKQLKEKAKEFIVNPYDDEKLPEKHRKNIPLLGDCMITEKHVISVQNDVGTSYKAYIDVQNELVAAYNELRDELGKAKFGKTYAQCDEDEQKAIREYYPQKISEAEPKKYGGK